jgi:hypothetical protein
MSGSEGAAEWVSGALEKLLGTDVSELGDVARAELAGKALVNAQKKFGDKQMGNLMFEQMHLIMMRASLLVFRSEPEGLRLYSKEDYEKYKGRFMANSGRVEEATHRKLLIDSYQDFEIFLADVITVLFFAFPNFLTSSNEGTATLSVAHEDLFAEKDVVGLRAAVIERRVKSILQAENIADVLKRVEKLFGIELEIDKATLDKLLTLSLKRNLLLHNDGVMNEVVRAVVRKYGIAWPGGLQLGVRMSVNDKDSEEARNLLYEVGNRIAEKVVGNLAQLVAYHRARSV